MKRTTSIILTTALACLMLSGCKLKTYYQVYQTLPVNTDACQQKEGMIVHDGNDCSVAYNFYAEDGHGGFWLTNNTDSVIFIYLDQSFFILNGEANDYYQARRWTTTNSQTLQSSTQSGKSKKKNKRSTSTTQGTSQTSTRALAYEERGMVMVPPHSTKHIAEFQINTTKLELCGVKETPSRSKPSGTSFTQDNSPITFGNYVTYTVGNGKKKHIDDRFFVSEIINVHGKAMVELVRQKDACGKPKGDKVQQLRYATPDRFYVTYKK